MTDKPVRFLTDLDPLKLRAVLARHGRLHLPGILEQDGVSDRDDQVAGKERLFAYVLNFTPSWRADWGGLLAFLAPDGHVSEAYTPVFNALNIIRVPQPHAVTQVASFAGGDRLSITGWIRARR